MPKRPASKPLAATAAPEFLPAGTLASVTWLDAAFDLDAEPQMYTLQTLGFVIRHNSSCICLAGEGDGAYFRAFTVIPAGLIQKITRLVPAS